MLLNKKYILPLAAIVLLAIAVAFIPGCDDNDNILPSVEFSYPKTYTGTYRVVQNWLAADSTWTQAYATFSFESDYTFHMWVDSSYPGVDFDVCSVEGSYAFTGDSLEITISNFNLGQDICVPDVGPDAKFRYTIDGDYVVFECRQDAPYRKIEMYGR